MHISRLRLLGFKSFVEPTELLIEKGLTGVVGPNGCGKSNLLEALRWVMGETSHKSMRAASMDDVIFSGTNQRPGRNAAEVTILIDNRARTAPAEFNDSDEIEIVRRIEREAGSAYRINGREVRARDIKVLFEDAATGARSPALVRQGQIGEIVNAKPEQRRRILEDAAGVAGLHTRRHEAELRLKAAEGNLAKIGDVLGALNSQIEGLKRQSRAAKRYRELSSEMRKAEATQAYVLWSAAKTLVDTEEAALSASLERLGAAVAAEARSLTLEAETAESLPRLREDEAVRGAVYAKLNNDKANFEREALRAHEREAELAKRSAELAADLAREQGLQVEAQEVFERLGDEHASLLEHTDQSGAEVEELRARLVLLDENRVQGEEFFADRQRASFSAQAEVQALAARASLHTEAVAKLKRQLAGLNSDLLKVVAQAPDATLLQATMEQGQSLVAVLADCEASSPSLEDVVRERSVEVTKARAQSQLASLEAAAIEAEAETLKALLVPLASGSETAALDAVKVTPGYEQALGAALGDDLDAPLWVEGHEPALVHWRTQVATAKPAKLPGGVTPLINFVDAPAELSLRIAHIGVVAADKGSALQSALSPGQRLVSLEGDLWRWDGFVAASSAPSAAGQRLALRNRLSEIEGRRQAAAQTLAEVQATEATAISLEAQAQDAERELRRVWRETQGELSRTRERLTVIERAARETDARRTQLEDAKAQAQDDLQAALEAEAEAALETDLVEQVAALDNQAVQARQVAELARNKVAEVRTRLAEIEAVRTSNLARIEVAAKEQRRWAERRAHGKGQIEAVGLRLNAVTAELAAARALPAAINERRKALLSELETAAHLQRTSADRLARVETDLKAAQGVLRLAQAQVATEREARARIEARLEGARNQRSAEARRIHDTLAVQPEGCLAIADLAPDAALPEPQEIERQLTRLRADRERLGGVNLSAEQELNGLMQQHEGLDTERADVETAINKLRGGIGQLNREARTRLLEAFEKVNGHFQRLFTSLFGGGEARLELVESEDPLEGGLEIIAKPPGKKPATLSLLSGGEQTLTALSLIFAVFLTNPSPICVLDEVDAPLDDSNVDRFSTLMEKMAAETETRFLVITHHPVTMARMQRLFGVTMAERGVSQLVSVNLAEAARLVEAEAA